jgi:hypothetical protein
MGSWEGERVEFWVNMRFSMTFHLCYCPPGIKGPSSLRLPGSSGRLSDHFVLVVAAK